MDFDNILLLMQQFSQLGLSKMELSYEHFSIKLEKEENVNTVSKSIAPEIIEVPKAAAKTETKTETETAEILNAVEVKAPLVGIFYEKSSPNAAPYVAVGQHVNAGDTVCIIEAMKVMNEIKAPVSGTIVDILVKDEDLVSYDQVLMHIKE